MAYLATFFIVQSASPYPGIGVYFFTSPDGVNFTQINWPIALDTSGSPASIRDPSIFYNNNDGLFYLTGSLTEPSGTESLGLWHCANIGQAWVQATSINTGQSSTDYSPEWFQDSDGSVHIIFANTLSGVTSTYEIHPNSNSNLASATWSSPALLAATTGYDPFIVLTGGTYYLYNSTSNSGGYDGISYRTASSLTGVYSTSTTVGAGTAEGPCVFQIGSTWYLYYDTNGSLFTGQEAYYTASSITGSFSGPNFPNFIVPPGISNLLFKQGTIIFFPVLPISETITISDNVLISLQVSTGSSALKVNPSAVLGIGRLGNFELGTGFALESSVGKSAADSISISDAASTFVSAGVAVSDRIDFHDVQTLFTPDANIPSLYTDDFFLLSDTIQVTLPAVSVVTKTVTDSFTITDTVGGAFSGLFVSVGDTITFLDNFNYLTGSLSDTINFWNDQVQFLGNSLVTITDLLVPILPFFIFDAFQILLQDATGVDIYVPTRADTITISDSVVFVLGVAEAKADSIAFSDSVTLFGADLVSVGDTLTLTDAAFPSAPTTPVIQPGDFFVISDFVQLLKTGFQTPASTDTLTLLDQLNLSLNQDEAKSDSIVITDTSIENLVIILNVADQLTFTDSEANNTPNLPDIVLGFGDGIGLADFVIVGSGEFINISDPIAMADRVGLDDEVAVALSPSLNSYIRRYLNDIVGVGNMGQGDN